MHAWLTKLLAIILHCRTRSDPCHRCDVWIAMTIHKVLEPGNHVWQIFDALEHQDRAHLHQRRTRHNELDDIFVIVNAV